MAHVSEQSRMRGARLTVSPYRKFDARMMPTTAKACGQYLNSRLATMDASRRGYDEALLLNIDGNVAEAAVTNVFVVNGRTLRTNDEKSSILMELPATRFCSLRPGKDSGRKLAFLRWTT